jgi:hypothetical protein
VHVSAAVGRQTAALVIAYVAAALTLGELLGLRAPDEHAGSCCPRGRRRAACGAARPCRARRPAGRVLAGDRAARRGRFWLGRALGRRLLGLGGLAPARTRRRRRCARRPSALLQSCRAAWRSSPLSVFHSRQRRRQTTRRRPWRRYGRSSRRAGPNRDEVLRALCPLACAPFSASDTRTPAGDRGGLRSLREPPASAVRWPEHGRAARHRPRMRGCCPCGLSSALVREAPRQLCQPRPGPRPIPNRAPKGPHDRLRWNRSVACAPFTAPAVGRLSRAMSTRTRGRLCNRAEAADRVIRS